MKIINPKLYIFTNKKRENYKTKNKPVVIFLKVTGHSKIRQKVTICELQITGDSGV